MFYVETNGALTKMVTWIEEVPDLCENDAKELGHGLMGLMA